jgi:hypothetical protein
VRAAAAGGLAPVGLREDRGEEKTKENSRTHVWRGNGGPPRMEAGRGDWEGYAK